MTADPDLALQTYDIQGSLQKDSQVTVFIVLENQSNSFLKSMELNVLDSLNTKLARPEGSSVHDGVPVPFQLPPGAQQLVSRAQWSLGIPSGLSSFLSHLLPSFLGVPTYLLLGGWLGPSWDCLALLLRPAYPLPLFLSLSHSPLSLPHQASPTKPSSCSPFRALSWPRNSRGPCPLLLRYVGPEVAERPAPSHPHHSEHTQNPGLVVQRASEALDGSCSQNTWMYLSSKALPHSLTLLPS